MKILHRKRVTALATIAATGALLLSAGPVSATSAKAARPKPGLYVTGEAAVSSTAHPTAYVVDTHNREHLVTLTPNAIHTGDDTVVYRTRPLGAKHWTVHDAPTLINGTGSPRVEELVDPSSGNIEVVVYTCDGVYAAEAHSSAGRLPEFTTVTTEDGCATASAAPSPFLVQAGVIGDPNDYTDVLGILVPDQTTTGTWDLFEGTPGSTFSDVSALPTADSFVPTQIVTAFNYSRYASVVGYGVDSSGDEGVFLSKLTWSWNSSAGQYEPAWSNPTEVATLGATDSDFVIESMTDYAGTIDVALYAAPGSFAGQKHTLFIQEGDKSGQWSGAIALQHTTLHDKNLIIVRNLDTGTMHATFQRAITSSKTAKTANSGVMKEYHRKGNWSTPAFMTHWFKDQPLQASLDTNDKLHVEYLRS
jgi:hypothetical protein